MFCFHKWGEIRDGYQYCDKCNAARVVGCCHKWKTVETGVLRQRSVTGEWLGVGRTYYSECEKCGIHKKEEFKLDMVW